MDEFRRMKEREQKAKEAELEYYRELAQLDEDESAWYWHLCQDAWNQEDIRIKQQQQQQQQLQQQQRQQQQLQQQQLEIIEKGLFEFLSRITRYYAELASDPILRTLRLIDLVFDVTRFTVKK